jgi:hypothetical protein
MVRCSFGVLCIIVWCSAYISAERLRTPCTSDAVYMSWRSSKRFRGAKAAPEEGSVELAQLPGSARHLRTMTPMLYSVSVTSHKAEEDQKTGVRAEENTEDIETFVYLDNSVTEQSQAVTYHKLSTWARTDFFRSILSNVYNLQLFEQVAVQAVLVLGLSFVSFAVFQLVLPFLLSPFLDLFLP